MATQTRSAATMRFDSSRSSPRSARSNTASTAATIRARSPVAPVLPVRIRSEGRESWSESPCWTWV